MKRFFSVIAVFLTAGVFLVFLCSCATGVSTPTQSVKRTPVRNVSNFEGLLISAEPANGIFKILVPVPYDPAHARPAELISVKCQPETPMFLRTQWNMKHKVAPGTLAKFFLGKDQLARLEAGKGFNPGRVEIEPGMKLQLKGAVKVLPAEFTSNRGGKAEFNGKKISFRTGYIFLHTPCTLKEVTPGYTNVRVWGKAKGEVYNAGSILFSPLPDPRKTDDPKLPRALVIGDSISMNYHNAAKAALKGKVNYHRINGNSGDSVNGNRNLELWLGPMQEKWQKWDVVLLNHGLHDLKQKGDRVRKTFAAKHQVEPEAYRKNIENILTKLTKHDFKVIVITTTPVPNDNFGTYGRHKDEELKYNAILLDVAKKFPKVQILDLNKVVRDSKVFDNWRKGNNVHYSGQEQVVLGKAVAAAILKSVGK